MIGTLQDEYASQINMNLNTQQAASIKFNLNQFWLRLQFSFNLFPIKICKCAFTYICCGGTPVKKVQLEEMCMQIGPGLGAIKRCGVEWDRGLIEVDRIVTAARKPAQQATSLNSLTLNTRWQNLIKWEPEAVDFIHLVS